MKRLNLTIILLGVVLSCLAQKNFSFQREISGVTASGYYAITLPSDIFQHFKDDFSDIRLYSINQSDTVEIPYLLQIKRKQVSTRDFTLPEFNRSSKGNTVFVTFELPPNTGLTNIDLSVEETNFFASVAIEGSDNKNDWFDIVRDQKIFGVSNAFENYRYTRVNFPETKYRFVRLAIESENQIHYQGTTFKAEEISPGEFVPVELGWTATELKAEKQTRLDVNLKYYQPLSVLQVLAENNKDFYRRCRIEILVDSVKSEKGWIRNYRNVTEGYITSFLDNIFELGNQSAKALRITIDNHDDQPIKVTTIRLSAPAVKVLAKLEPGSNFLLYGNKIASFPSYDFRYFERKLPSPIPEASLGVEVDISKQSAGVNALFENKVWLWVIILVVIAVLGTFTVRMMKVKETT